MGVSLSESNAGAGGAIMRGVATAARGAIEEAARSAPRHPATVTAERVAEAMEKFADRLTPNEVGCLSTAYRALADIGEGRRA